MHLPPPEREDETLKRLAEKRTKTINHATECVAVAINDLIDQRGGQQIPIVIIEETVRKTLIDALDDGDTPSN